MAAPAPRPALPSSSSFPISLIATLALPHEGARCTSSGARPKPTHASAHSTAQHSTARYAPPDFPICVWEAAQLSDPAPHTPAPLVFPYFQASVTQASEAPGPSHLARLFLVPPSPPHTQPPCSLPSRRFPAPPRAPLDILFLAICNRT